MRKDRDDRARHPDRDREAAKKLDESEKEKRLREMMQNAQWRDEQRAKNVQHHREKVRTKPLGNQNQEKSLESKRSNSFSWSHCNSPKVDP